jgi:hypothetical protein
VVEFFEIVTMSVDVWDWKFCLSYNPILRGRLLNFCAST